jgi:hypothetical protein
MGNSSTIIKTRISLKHLDQFDGVIFLRHIAIIINKQTVTPSLQQVEIDLKPIHTALNLHTHSHTHASDTTGTPRYTCFIHYNPETEQTSLCNLHVRRHNGVFQTVENVLDVMNRTKIVNAVALLRDKKDSGVFKSILLTPYEQRLCIDVVRVIETQLAKMIDVKELPSSDL